MTTALELITGAARLIGVVYKSEALSADEAADGLVALNDMLASWSNEGLLCISRTRESFSVSAASSYAIGSGQTLNTTRPLNIKEAYFRIGDTDYPMEEITDSEYERLQQKSTATTYPEYFNYDNAHPYGTIRVYPALASSGTLHLLSEKPLSNVASLSTSVDLPPGWNRAVRYNLAIDLAPEYGQDVPAAVANIANSSLAAIRIAIAKNRPIRTKLSKPTGNIYNGYNL